MKKLANILFITHPEAKCSLSNGAIVIETEETGKQRMPLHNIESIVSFSFSAPSSCLMAECAKEGISYMSLSPYGNFRYRICGETRGNVNTRLAQYRFSEDSTGRLELAGTVLQAKLNNCRVLLSSYGKRLDGGKAALLGQAAKEIGEYAAGMSGRISQETLRGLEGTAAKTYYSVFDLMISSPEPEMHFPRRSKQPPEDPVNVLLSLAYTQLTYEYVHALENAGLDPYVGILHGTRPGKPSLALDVLEEMRPWADRFVLRLINLGIIKADMFEKTDDGIRLGREGLRKFYSEYNSARTRELYLDSESQKAERGVIPYVQARHAANFILGTETGYVPFTMRE